MSAVAALILAAGRGSRFHAAGGTEVSKLLVPLEGRPIVAHVVQAALRSMADPVIVVTGHAHEAIEAALVGFPIEVVHNPDFASGLASTLRRGAARLPEASPGIVVLLGDMPAIDAATVDRLIAAGDAQPDVDAVIATHAGVRGNPVVLMRSLFPAIGTLVGDAGARGLLRQPGLRILEVPCDAAVALDIDVPGDLAPIQAARTAR